MLTAKGNVPLDSISTRGDITEAENKHGYPYIGLALKGGTLLAV